MGERIRQLEDALTILQSTHVKEPHPLLCAEMLLIKFWPDVSAVQEEKEVMPEQPVIDALGTLTIGDTGETKYFGPSAGSETLLSVGRFYSVVFGFSAFLRLA